MNTRLERAMKHNSDLIDLIFKLLFETIWLSPHDPRCSVREFVEFKQNAKQLVVALHAADIEKLDMKQFAEVGRLVESLSGILEQISRKKMITASAHQKAGELLREITQRLQAVSAAAELR